MRCVNKYTINTNIFANTIMADLYSLVFLPVEFFFKIESCSEFSEPLAGKQVRFFTPGLSLSSTSYRRLAAFKEAGCSLMSLGLLTSFQISFPDSHLSETFSHFPISGFFLWVLQNTGHVSYGPYYM